mmetsp:Transcript_34611/g.83925  ORF Transcript_34611/g.83925 Transcript_34611/m.83925 type:complete len:118 (-) Transcript_34611:245-598(-)
MPTTACALPCLCTPWIIVFVLLFLSGISYCFYLNSNCSSKWMSQDGEETIFKIKKSTKLSKVFIRYARDKNVQLSSLRFLFDGERIEEKDTPKTLEMVSPGCESVPRQKSVFQLNHS